MMWERWYWMFGSSTVKAGYAGEECPKVVFNSVVGVDVEGKSSASSSSSSKGEASKKCYAGQDFSFRRDHMEATYPIKHGLVDDWDGVEKLWDHAFSKALEVDPSQHPILISEPAFNPRGHREELVKHMFEKFNVPAMFVCKDAVLAAFSMGRCTALVLNSGGGVTSCVPVHDGYALLKSCRRTRLAGDYLTEALESQLAQRCGQIPPRYSIKGKSHGKKVVKMEQMFPNTTDSYKRFWQLDVVRDIKETHLQVRDAAEAARTCLVDIRETDGPKYELPDGKTVNVGRNKHTITELLFEKTFNPQLEDDLDPNFRFAGLPQMIADVVNSSDADIRKDLYSSVILCGGNTRFKGLANRLSAEIVEFLPPAFKLKITIPNTPVEKRFGVWIGGSILGSLGSFQQLWISKNEFQEHGASIVHRRCP
eukprot:TRINITY_DN1855_c0_g1_i1.p1 TRINITY_DN1855_c0_g1~~TRINITY_DN1855_c0_g1_i1.p1  ORF type:complete len:423 (+),score=104.27 TRINITY_DN1855_c0_g1_i1:127-1395(+)